ncbi:MAG TPA: SCO family protein [Chitinophagaceae bacterium]|nr:SCO family protein [Chitinophagaceae bacterium]
MRKPATIWFFLACILLVPATAFTLYSWYDHRYARLPVLGQDETEKAHHVEHRLADFLLVNQDGQPRSLNWWENQILVVNFFYSHCPVVCPQMTTNLRRVQDAFREDPRVAQISISVDPERDSSSQLSRYSARFRINPAKWQLLTGDKRTIYKLARNSFRLVATDGDGGPDDFIHSDRVVLVDPRHRLRGYYDGTDTLEINNLIRDIKKLQHEN